jgi:hypothetical protein
MPEEKPLNGPVGYARVSTYGQTLDRLARSTFDLFAIVRQIVDRPADLEIVE